MRTPSSRRARPTWVTRSRSTAPPTFGVTKMAAAIAVRGAEQPLTLEISRLGCFVKTATPFPSGESVSLRITHDGIAFAVTGMVVYAASGKGMGIVFGAIPIDDQRVLENWLAESVN